MDEPIANSSMLVLPSMTMPAPLSRAMIVASYGGTPALEDLRAGGGRQALGRRRRPSSRAARRPAGRASPPAARRASTAPGRGQRARRCRRAGRRAPARRPRRSGPGGPGSPRPRTTSPAAMRRAELGRGRAGSASAHHASSSRIRGTRNRSSSAVGRAGEHLVPRQARARPRPARSTLVSGTACDGRRDVGGGDLTDPGHRAAGSRRAGRRRGPAPRRSRRAGPAAPGARPRRG